MGQLAREVARELRAANFIEDTDSSEEYAMSATIDFFLNEGW